MKAYRSRTEARHPRNPPCRFLVPDRWKPLLDRHLKQQNTSMRRYLKRLLRMARQNPRSLPCKKRITTRYQPSKQSLQKVNFRPEGRDWGEFKTIARGCGVSMCRLFVHLMLQDKDHLKIRDAVATSIRAALREIVRFPGKKVVRILQNQQKPPDRTLDTRP